MKDINPAGFNFHCPDNRSYVIFDPQSQEENDRLDTVLGASTLWKSSIAKRFDALRKTDRTMIQPFSELIPVGFVATSDETVAVVLAGAIAKYDGESSTPGNGSRCVSGRMRLPNSRRICEPN
jgi:hypothetical protein